MTPNQFAPQSATQATETTQQRPITRSNKNDQISGFLLKGMRTLVVCFAFLLPVFFWPGLWATLGFQKSILAVALTAFVVIIGSLLALRTRQAETVLPIPLAVFSGFLTVAVASVFASADISTALRGSMFEVQTFAFLLTLFAVMCLPLVLQQSKRYVFYVCAALGSGLLLLLLYSGLRLVVGPILAFSSFPSATQSPVGNFNDLALFAGLTVMLSIITLLQLRLRVVTQGVIAGIVALSLVVLAVVNFWYVWVVVGFFGLLVLLYLLSYDSLFAESTGIEDNPGQGLVLGLIGVVCLVSGMFVVIGDAVGERVAAVFDVEYLEVRPSLQANIDIAQGTYSENLLLGVGPNQFEQAWREFKDPAINQTLFWDTDFIAGSGFVPTLFVTLGLLGGIAFVLFHASYLWLGIRTLLRPTSTDSFWYFAGLFSFVGAVFLWGMSYVYVPGATVLLLAAFLTGLSFVAMGDLQPATRKVIPLVTNHKRGFIIMTGVIFSITGAMFVLFSVGEQYIAQSSFNQAQQVATSLAEIDQAAMDAYAMYPDDRFLGVRARVALLEMNRLFAIQEPSEADQQRFVEVADLALRFANAAISSAPQNPDYHAIMAGIFNNYALAGIEGALERSNEALAEAKKLDPKNPTYALMEGQMAAARGDADASRAAITDALQQKPNFAQALYLLAELDIAQGDIESAIEATRAIITLEPQNPARYYQIGILFTAAEQPENALVAYRDALTLDPNFANARYLRALLLVDQGDIEAALSDLRLVAETNPENQQLLSLITSLEAGEVPAVGEVASDLVDDISVSDDGAGLSSPVDPATDLVTPLNTVPEQGGTETTETTNVPAAVESETAEDTTQ